MKLMPLSGVVSDPPPLGNPASSVITTSPSLTGVSLSLMKTRMMRRYYHLVMEFLLYKQYLYPEIVIAEYRMQDLHSDKEVFQI